MFPSITVSISYLSAKTKFLPFAFTAVYYVKLFNEQNYKGVG